MSELNGSDYSLTTREVAEQLRVTDRTIRRWIAGDKIPYSRIGKSIRFSQSDIDQFWPGRHQQPALTTAIEALQAIGETTDHEQAMAIAHEALTNLEKWT